MQNEIIESKQSLMLLGMQMVGNLLSDQGSVAAGSVVNDQVDPDPVLHGLVYDFCRVLDHFRVQHAGDHFVKWERLSIGFLVAHLRGVISRMTTCFPELKNILLTLANCFLKGGSQVQWKNTKPMPCFFRTS